MNFEKKRVIGSSVAQAFFALMLTFFVTQGACAADVCDCPECPAQACAHVDCISGHDGAGCPDMTGVACARLSGVSLLPAPRLAGLSVGAGVAAVGSSIVAGIARDASHAPLTAALGATAPPAYIVFCRLLR